MGKGEIAVAIDGFNVHAGDAIDAEKFAASIMEHEKRIKDLRMRIATIGTEADGFRGRARTMLAKLSR